MKLYRLLKLQLEKQGVGTLTLGRTKGFREIFFDRDSLYLVGNEFAGKIEFEKLWTIETVRKRIDTSSLENIILSTNLNNHLLPQVLFDQGLIDEQELEPLAKAQLKEEIFHLLSQDVGSFHYQEGRVPEFLLQFDGIHTRIPLSLMEIVELLNERGELLKKFDSLIPSNEEVFVITEKGMAYKQTISNDFVEQRVLNMVDGFRDHQTILSDCYLFKFKVNSVIAKALEEGHIKKTLHPELKGISVSTLSKFEALKRLKNFKNAVRFGVDELAARERLALVYEKLDMASDAVIQYNFVGDRLFRMRKPGKAIKAYQRALELKPGEALLTDKITNIYVNAAEDERVNGNVEQAIQLYEGALRLSPEDTDIASRLLDLLIEERHFEEIVRICDSLTAIARKTRIPEGAICLLECAARLQVGNYSFRKKLINLYLDFDKVAEAIEEMETLAQEYLEHGQEGRAEELLTKIQRLQGQGYDSQLIRRIDKARGKQKKNDSKMCRRLIRVAIACGLMLVVVYQLWALIAWTRITHTYALDSTDMEPITAQELLSRVSLEERESLVMRPGSREAEFRTLAECCDNFVFQFGGSVLCPFARKYQDWASSNARILAGAREAAKKKIIETAERKWEQEGDIQSVMETLQPLLVLDSSDPTYTRASELQEEWSKSERSSAKELAEEAEKLLQEHYALTATSSVKAGDKFDQAVHMFENLRKRYPESEYAREFLLPMWIRTIPTGAAVRVLPSNVGTPHSTPATLRIPNEACEFHFEKKGFDSDPLFLTSNEVLSTRGKLVRVLERRPQRVIRFKTGFLAATPVISDNHMFWSTDSGTLNWTTLEAAGGNSSAVASKRLPGTRVVGTIALTHDALWSRWDDSKIRRLPFHQLVEKSPTFQAYHSKRIVTTNLCANDTSPPLVVFGIEGELVRIDSDGINSGFRPQSAEGFRPSTLTYHANSWSLYVGGRTGFVHQLSVASGRRMQRLWPGWSEQLTDEPIRQIYCTDTHLVIQSDDRYFIRRAEDGKPDPQFKKDSYKALRISCVQSVPGKIVSWSSKRGLESLDITSRAVTKAAATLAHILAHNGVVQLVPMARSLGVIYETREAEHSERRRILMVCDSETLEPQWATRVSTDLSHALSTEKWSIVASKQSIALFAEQ